jgi:glycosyl transferase family 87
MPANTIDSRANLAQRLWLALLNRRFRTVLLVGALAPIGLFYLSLTLVGQLLHPVNGDFIAEYVPAARLIASGGDLYGSCISNNCFNTLDNGWWFYPPLVPWLAQPFTHVDPGVASATALLVGQACIAVFVWVMARALRIRDWQLIGLWVMAVISFPPLLSEVIERNVQVILLALSAIWFAGWLAGDRWWGGLALGAGIALKLVQAPLFLLGAWFRRVRATIAAALAVAVLWALAAPQYLGAYLFEILPRANTASGWAMNVSASAVVTRLIHPESLYGYGTGVDTTVRIIGYAIVALVVAITVIALRAPRQDRDGRALEAALGVAASPLVVAYVRPGQLLLLLLPMMVLGTLALRKRDWRLGAGIAASWLLVGPIYLWFSHALAGGLAVPLLRFGAETAFVGTLILWLAALQALRFHGAAEHAALPASHATAEPALGRT